MDGSLEEPSTGSDDAEDREKYIPFLSKLINRLTLNGKNPTKLEEMLRAYDIMTLENKSCENKELHGEVRTAIKALYEANEQDKKRKQKSNYKKTPPAVGDEGEYSGLPRTARISAHASGIKSHETRRHVKDCARSPDKDQTTDDVVIIDPEEDCLPIGKVCADIRRLSHETLGDTSCKSDETNDRKVNVIHYLDWKFIPVCGLQLKPARNNYDCGSVTDNNCDPRLRSMPSTSDITGDARVVDDSLNMDSLSLAPETETFKEPAPVLFDNNKLAELIKWTQERLQPGVNVENMCNVALDRASNSGVAAVHVETRSAQDLPAAAIKTEDGAGTYYRDVTPFHLLLQGGTPLLSAKTEQGATFNSNEGFRKRRRKKKKKVKAEVASSSINCRGEIVDVEYEARRRERKLAEEKEKEDAAKVSNKPNDSNEAAGTSIAETRNSGEVVDLERLAVDESDEEQHVSGVGRSMAVRKSHEHYARYVQGKRREEDRLKNEERKKREEKREAQRREERAKREKQQRQYEEQQRFAQHNAPFGFGGPMMQYYPTHPMSFYPQMPMQPLMPIVYGQHFGPPMHPHQRPQVQLGGSGSCVFCPFNGEPSLIMSHYVNDHLDKEPPVRIPSDQLKSILRGEDVDEERSKRENVLTGVKWLDDLSWIPIEIRFIEPQTCKTCNYSTNIRRNLIEHVQSHRKAVVNQQTEEKAYQCRLCTEKMTDIEKFYEHCTSHTGEYMYACGHCGFRGYSREDVKEHINREHPGRNIQIKSNGTVFGGTIVYGYMCPDCGYVQMAEKRVESHIHSVHGKQLIQAKKMNMAKMIRKPVIPQSSTAVVSNPAQPPPSAITQPKAPSRSVPKRRPPVKIRGDPRTATSRNNMEPSPPVDRRRSGVVGQRPRTPFKSAAPIGPLLENGMLEGDDTNEPNNIPETSNNDVSLALSTSASSFSVVEPVTNFVDSETEQTESSPQLAKRNTEEVPSYLRHCKLERPIVDDGTESEHLSDNEGDGRGTKDVAAVQDEPQSEMDIEVVQAELLTEEMKLVTDIDVEEPQEETPSEIVVVKCEEVTVREDNNNAPGVIGNANPGENPGYATIADTISKLAATLQSKTGTMNKKTRSTSAQTSDITSVVASTAIQDNTPRLSNRRMNDWKLRMKSLICNCGFLCVSMEALAQHRAHWHKSERRIHCSECYTRCEDVVAFTEHFQKTCNKIPKKMFVCSLEPLCRFFTSSQQQFLSHMKTCHNKLQWLPCHWCGKQYTTPDCLVTHIHRMCTAKEKLMNAMQIASAVTKAEQDSGDVPPYTVDVGSPEDPAAPHLEVVYRCAIPNCKHRSLEREVFFDHMHVVHPEKTEYTCMHCEDLTFRNLNALILHIEDKHREGVTADTEEAPRSTYPVPSTSSAPSPSGDARMLEKEPVVTSPAVSRLPVSPCVTSEAAPNSEDNAASIEGVNPTAISQASLGGMEGICKTVAMFFQVISSNSLDDELFQQILKNWRISNIPNKGNIHPLTVEAKDPVSFVKQHKTPEALKAINSVQKLMHLFKCGSKNCSFTSDDATEFQNHLSAEACRDGMMMVCLYCGESHKTVRGITSHIAQHHSESVYQCPECTYRCRQKANMLVHAKKAHQADTAVTITCEAPVGEVTENIDNEGPDLLSLILPIVCTADDCDFISMDIMAIQGHIRESHPTLVQYDCFHCGCKVDVDALEVHLETHNIFKFHCRYCCFATNNGNDIVVHVCQMHPHRTGRVFIRTTLTYNEQNASSRRNVQPPPSLPGGVIIKEEPVDELPPRSEAIASPDPETASSGSVGATAANLFSCGYRQCRFSAPTILALDEHIRECSKKYVGERLCCKQCRMPFRNMNSFLNHVRSHQAKLYFCGLCDYNKQLIYYVKEHMQNKHGLQFTETKCVPRYPSGSKSDMAEFVFEPTLPSLRIRIDPNAGAAVLPPTQAAAVAHAEEVGDIDSVPVQSIFSKEIKCTHCDFATKVRTNLIRHLDQHKRIEDNQKVVAPFTSGHATSSQSTAPSVETVHSVDSLAMVDPGLRLWHPTVFPEYIDKKERYQCCVKNCSFRASDSGTFEDHVSKEHTNLLVFSCPHCGITTDVMANIIRHLSLHGPNLYKCPYCTYVNTGRQLVLGHGLADHPGVPNYVNIVREKQELDIRSNLLGRMNQKDTYTARPDSVRDVEQLPGSKVAVVYTCPLCDKFQNDKMSVMKSHMFNELKYAKFECNHCKIKTSTKSNMVRHLQRIHPDQSSDSFTVNRNENFEKLVSGYLEALDSAAGKSGPIGRSQNAAKGSKTDSVEPPRVHCPHCSYSSTKEECVRSHVLSHVHYQSYKCRLCQSQFGRIHQLQSHHNVQHPGTPCKPLNESDRDIATFVDWVIKLVQNPAVKTSQANFNLKPWTLPCKYDGCQLQFSSLKKFSDHFKEHLQQKAKQQTQKRVAETDSNEVWSIDLNVNYDDDDDDDERDLDAPSTSTDKPKRKRKKLNSSGSEAVPSFISLCPFCSYSKPGSVVNDHLLRHYDFRFYKCKYCNYEGVDSSEVKDHSKRAHVGVPFACERLTMPKDVTIRKIGTREHFLIERGSLGAYDALNPDPEGQYWCFRCKYATNCMNSARYHCQYAHGIGTFIRCLNIGPMFAVPMWANLEPVSLTDNGDSNSATNSVECTMCEKVLPDMSAWLQHFNAEHKDPTEFRDQPRNKKKRRGKPKETECRKDLTAAFQCKYCSYSCLQVTMMTRHQQMQHSDEAVSYERVENATVHQCPKCTYTSTDFSEATSHILSHLHQFKCGLCRKTASTERGIQRHSATVHSMHRVRVVRNPEYEKQKKQLLRRISPPQDEISVENVCIQDGLEYQVLSSNPSASSSEPSASSPQSRTVARKSTCKSPQKLLPSNSGETLTEMKAKVKRKIDWPLASQWKEDGISHYGKRPAPMDTSKLTVYTNFRGMQNARTTVDHLGEIFNLNPIIIVKRTVPNGS